MIWGSSVLLSLGFFQDLLRMRVLLQLRQFRIAGGLYSHALGHCADEGDQPRHFMWNFSNSSMPIASF